MALAFFNANALNMNALNVGLGKDVIEFKRGQSWILILLLLLLFFLIFGETHVVLCLV